MELCRFIQNEAIEQQGTECETVLNLEHTYGNLLKIQPPRSDPVGRKV